MKNLEEMEQNSKIFECASVCLGKIEKVYPQLSVHIVTAVAQYCNN